MITTVIAVVALVLAFVAIFVAIAIGTSYPPHMDIECIARGVWDKKNQDERYEKFKSQSDYSKGFNDGYSKMLSQMNEEKYRARSLEEHERFALLLSKATKPIHQLEKDLGIKT